MNRRLISLVLTICLILPFGMLVFAAEPNAQQKGYIDNSSLVPAYVTDDKVKLEPSNGGKLMSPDWVKTLIIMEVNALYASPNGKLSGMSTVLQHLQEMGVNGIWLTPIQDGSHYLNGGPATVNTYITDVADKDYEAGWKAVAEFVKEAHKRNIRVFFDIVTWGADPNSDIVKEHPSWFNGYSEKYKGQLYNWENTELVNWFANQLIDIIRKTNADGFRADCGIDYCGPELYRIVRNTLYKEGKYIALFGETISDETADIFDFNEHSVDYNIATEGSKFIDGTLNIVSATKTGYGIDTKNQQRAGTAGKNRFYTSIVTCHDSLGYLCQGSYVPLVYASVLSPYIPLWFIGEEWNNPYNSTGWLWDNRINWNMLKVNRDYYETVKAYIRIRRLYPEIFEYFPLNHRDSNICEVETDHIYGLQSYARYMNGKGILVVPNYNELNSSFEIKIPYERMGMPTDKVYSAINLMTGKTVATGKGTDLVGISCTIPKGHVAVYLVEPAAAGAPITVQRSKDTAVVSPETTKPKTVTTARTVDSQPSASETDTEDTYPQESTITKDNETGTTNSTDSDQTGADNPKASALPWIITSVVVVALAGVASVIWIRKKNTQ